MQFLSHLFKGGQRLDRGKTRLTRVSLLEQTRRALDQDLPGGWARAGVPALPGQQKQYSRSPIAHCSTVPAARARLSAARQPPSRCAWPRPSPAPSLAPPLSSSALLRFWRSLLGGERAPREEEERCKPPLTYLFQSWPGEPVLRGTHARLAEPHLPTSSQGGIAAPHVLNRLKHFKT